MLSLGLQTKPILFILKFRVWLVGGVRNSFGRNCNELSLKGLNVLYETLAAIAPYVRPSHVKQQQPGQV